MRYTYEYKRKCVELYREGKWPETPEGVSDKSFRDKVRLWVRAEDSRGPEALKHKNFNRNWTPEERLELVSQVMSGNPVCQWQSRPVFKIDYCINGFKTIKQRGIMAW